MPNQKSLLTCLLSLLLFSGTAAADLAADIRTCGLLTGDTERLHCYDTVEASLTDADKTAAEPAPAAKKGFMQRINDAVGRDRLKRDKKPEASGQVIEADYAITIKRCVKSTSSNRLTFELDNGQVWRQKNARWLSTRNCEGEAMISEGYFGHRLTINPDDRPIGVIRVQ